MSQTCNLSTGEAEAGGHKFKASLGYIVKPCFKQIKPKCNKSGVLSTQDMPVSLKEVICRAGYQTQGLTSIVDTLSLSSRNSSYIYTHTYIYTNIYFF
jgi:hypothetical protein